MPKIDLKPKVVKFIKALPAKHQRQVKNYLLALADNPNPHDARPLIGYENYLRADIGEHRIIYRFDKTADLVTVVLAGKRNDDEIYRIAKRML